ncbi:MAG: DUF3667 domain-containing protein [Pseudomonadota bacterium]
MLEPCLNCGAARSGRFCTECGQDGDRRLANLPTLIRRGASAVLDVDEPLLKTLRRLFLNPGRLTRDYAEGRFASQVSPLRLYLVASAIYFFLAPYLGGGFVRLQPETADGAWFSFGPLNWDSELLLLLLVPLFAVVLRVMLPDRSRHVEELFVFSVHYNVFFLLMITVLGVLGRVGISIGQPQLTIAVILVGMTIPFTYLWLALRRAFDLGAMRTLVSTPVLFVLHMGAGQLLQNTV